MQADLSPSLKTIEFFIENKGSKLSLQDVDQLIKDIDGVQCAQVDPSTGEAKVALVDDSTFHKKFIEIQRALYKVNYLVTAKNTNGIQAVLFFGTMAFGFIFAVAVIILFYWFGSLPSLV